MKVTTERLPDSQLTLEIEVESERLEQSLDKAYRRLVKRTRVPGFRKGKAPRQMLESYIGRDTLLHEALDILVPEVYSQALEAEDIDPIDTPRIEIIQEEPPLIKATVPLRPSIDLGDYQSLYIERAHVEASDEEVESSLEDLRRRYAIQEPVERPVKIGDVIRADIRAVVEEEEIFVDEDVELRLAEGGTLLLPGFAEGLVGVEKGIPIEVDTIIPQGDEPTPLAGKTCRIFATVKDIKHEELPDLDDEFASGVGEGFPGLKELREWLEDDIKEKKQAAAEESHREKVIDALVASAPEIAFPPVIVEREIDRQMQEEARMVGGDVHRYLKQTKQTEEDRREELRPGAEERVRRSLALSQLADLEEIEVTADDVEAEMERMVTSAGSQSEGLKNLFNSDNGKEAIERSLFTRKTLDRLVEIASATGTDKIDEKPVETTGGK